MQQIIEIYDLKNELFLIIYTVERKKFYMSNTSRIHGDNIIECERIANLIVQETQPSHLNISLLSPSTISYDMDFTYCGYNFSWHLELLPGFNKSGRRR